MLKSNLFPCPWKALPLGLKSLTQTPNWYLIHMMLLFAEQFPEPDLEKIEDEAMPDSVDAISVIQELPVCH